MRSTRPASILFAVAASLCVAGDRCDILFHPPLSPSIAHLPSAPWGHVEQLFQEGVKGAGWGALDVVKQKLADAASAARLAKGRVGHTRSRVVEQRVVLPVDDMWHVWWANATCQRDGCGAQNVTHGRGGRARKGGVQEWRHVMCTACAAGDSRYQLLQGRCIKCPKKATFAAAITIRCPSRETDIKFNHTRTALALTVSVNSTATGGLGTTGSPLALAPTTGTHCANHRPPGALNLAALRRTPQKLIKNAGLLNVGKPRGPEPVMCRRNLPCQAPGCNATWVTHGAAAASEQAGRGKSSSARWIKFRCGPCAQGNPLFRSLYNRCQVCTRQACFGKPGGKPREATHCSEHKGSDLVDVRHALCGYHEGCKKRAQFGSVKGGRSLFCGTHRQQHHLDLSHKQCFAAGCSKRALYGNATTGPRTCRTHRDSLTHRNMQVRLCAHCNRTAYYGTRRLGAFLCSEHRQGHVDVVNQMCQYQGPPLPPLPPIPGVEVMCNAQATWGDPSERKTRWCARHRGDGDVLLRGRVGRVRRGHNVVGSRDHVISTSDGTEWTLFE